MVHLFDDYRLGTSEVRVCKIKGLLVLVLDSCLIILFVKRFHRVVYRVKRMALKRRWEYSL